MDEQKQSNVWIWIIIAIIVIAGLFFLFTKKGTTPTVENGTEVTTEKTPTSSLAIRPYGEVTLKLGESANFNGISITPTSIVEDSRCPADVQCIQAGTVRVNVKSLQNGGKSQEDVVTLNSPIVVGTFSINLTAVAPATKAGTKIANADYRLTFRVNQSAVIDTELKGK